MPLDWKILHEERLVHAIATGQLSSDEIQSYLGSVIAAHAMPHGKLFDITQVTAFGPRVQLGEVGDTVRLYDKMKLGPIGPLAIVAVTDDAVSYAQAFVPAAPANRLVQVFNDAAEARAWLVAMRTRG
jgi:hypothetical protein